MGTDIDAILRNMGIKDQFDSKAKEAVDKAKAETGDQSIFESKDKFVEHYTNELFGGSSNDEIEMDEGFFKKINVEDEEEIQNFYQAFDGRDGKDPDQKLSKDEAGLMLGAVYDATAEKPELYDTVKLQPWGTKDDDCLSRIIGKHADGIKLYSDDYNTYLNEMCKLNDIDDPNIVETGKEIKMPAIKADSEGNFIRDEDGNIQFYSEDELKEKKNLKDEIKLVELEDGTFCRETTDFNGNITKTEFLESSDENAEVSATINYKYDDNGKKVSFEQTNKDGLTSSGTYDDQGRVLSEETTTAPGNTVHTKYEYNEDGTSKRIDTKDDGCISETQVDKDGRDIKSTTKFPDGITWESVYKYNDDGTCENTIEASDGTKTILKMDKTGLPESEVSTYSNGTVSETKYFEGRQSESTVTEKDGSVIHTLISRDKIFTYEKKDADGKIIESGKKDSYGEISNNKSEHGGAISIREYEDGSTIEWQKYGSEMGSVYKDGKALYGSDFINWLNVDNSIKEQLDKWAQEQETMPPNSEIYSKLLELKPEAEN